MIPSSLSRAMRGACCAVVMVVANVTSAAAQTEIILAPGDSVAYSVIGAPELTKVSVIGPDGHIQLPSVGWIKASGVTIQQLRSIVEKAVSNRPYRVSGASGEDTWRRVSPNDLVIDVDAYRPVYLTGDVRSGGEIAYRPGLTVRQAVAQAGGLGLSLDTAISPLELLELSTQRDLLVGEIEFVEATLERLEVDLKSLRMTDTSAKLDLPPDNRADDVAQRWLNARETERQMTAGNTKLRLEQMSNRLEVLEKLQQTNTTNLQIEQDLMERTKQLVERGVSTASSLVDARRSLLQLSMQELETSGEIYRLRLDMARTGDEVNLLRTAQRVGILERVAQAQASQQSLRKRLSTLDTRISLLGGQLLIAPQNPTYRFEVFQVGALHAIVSENITDQILLPGDVLNVTLLPPQPEGTKVIR